MTGGTVPVALSLGLTLLVLHTPVLPSSEAMGGALAVLIVALVAALVAALIAAWFAALIVTRAFGLISGLFFEQQVLLPRTIRNLGIAVLPACLGLYEAALWSERQLPKHCERAQVTVRGTVLGLVETHRDFQRLHLRVTSIRPAHCEGPRRIRLYLSSGAPWLNRGYPLPPAPDLASGDRVTLQARLRRPWGYVNPASLTGERSYVVQGLHALGTGKLVDRVAVPGSTARVAPDTTELIPVPGPGREHRGRIDRYRDAVSTWIRGSTEEGIGALLAALAVGDKRFLDDATWDRLRRFGITHLMVISGLHVSLVALFGWYLGSAIATLSSCDRRLARCLGPLAALAAATGYALLAGLSLPTLRALLMLSLAMLPRALGRPGYTVHALVLALWLLLICQPLAILGASFWLSVGAVCLLVWWSQWQRSDGVRSMLKVQAYIILAMTPLSLFWFSTASTAGAAVNLVAIPLVSFVVVPMLLISVVLHHMNVPGADQLLSLCSEVADTAWRGLGALEPLLPAAESTPRELSTGATVSALIAALLVPVPAWRGKRRCLALLLLPAVFPLRSAPAGLELTVYDVGQGTAVLVRSENRSLLYDTGPGPPAGPPVAERTILPHFGSLGLAVLDYLVLSHPDLDHIAGEGAVRDRVRVRSTLRGVAGGAKDAVCRAGQVRSLGGTTRFTILSGGEPADNDNNRSCVLLLRHGRWRFLLPGDIHSDRERELTAYWGSALRADVLLAGHHGSNSSSGRLWLRRVSPRHLVVTAGRSNRFGHPAFPVLQRAEAQGLPVLNTAGSGAIVYRVNAAGALTCRRYRHRLAPFWRRGSLERNCTPDATRRAGIIAPSRSGGA